MPKIGKKHYNDVIWGLAQRIVAYQHPGCYIPPSSSEIPAIYDSLEQWLRKKGFDPNRFEFPQTDKKQKGIAVTFDTGEHDGIIKTSIKKKAAP